MNVLPRVRMSIEGVMPERALLRLKRADISLYRIKKPQKNTVLFSVKKKDCEKVFAIYPNVCYNNNGYSPYVAKKIGAFGFARWSEKLRNRVGLFLGGLLFCAVTLYADSLVLGVDFTASNVYAREALQTLEARGIKAFAPYKSEEADLICAELMRLDGVEFCSVKKTGLRVQVEMRLSRFTKPSMQSGDMTARHTGTILSISALKGTPLCKVGDEVTVSQPLVGAYIQKSDGERVKTTAIARVSIACVYENAFDVESEEEAFANGYLCAGLSQTDTLISRVVERRDSGYFVRLEYVANEAFNL